MKQSYYQRAKRWAREKRSEEAPFQELKTAVRKIVKEATGLNATTHYTNGRGIKGAGGSFEGYEIGIDTYGKFVSVRFNAGSFCKDKDRKTWEEDKLLKATQALEGSFPGRVKLERRSEYWSQIEVVAEIN